MTPDQEIKARVVAEKIMNFTVHNSNLSFATKDKAQYGDDIAVYLHTGNGMVELMEALRAQHRFVSTGYELNMATGEIIAGAAISPIRIFSYDTRANGGTPAKALLNAAYELVKDDE